MLTDEELAAVPEELLKDLLRYSEYGWRDRRIVSLLARCYPVVLTEADVRTALADEGWRAVAEANRAEMFDAGLWGVPSFRVGDRPAQWGQDRLWAVERDLSAMAGEAE